ncbi:MAG: hypothetical protein SWE60_01320 [Thermodesulfobacteriota bacterium]|nr:hypothetical protein [Thermodesulfobacteriota bacterium]
MGLVESLYCITIPFRMGLTYLAARLCWCFFRTSERKEKRRKRHILLVVKYRLSIFYALHHIELLADDSNLSFYMTSPRRMRSLCLDEIAKKGIDVHYVSLWDAITSDWDLISFPHHYLGALFHPSVPKIFISHGLENGKRIACGSGYIYGWKAVLRDHESYYTKFFATSRDEFNIAKADKHARAFTNKIAVTSDAMALKLLEKNRDRERVRSDLGITSNDQKAVLLMSTWGANSLLRTIGPAIVDEAMGLSTKYRFFVFAHAHNFQHTRGLKILNALRAKGIEVIEPGPSSWIPYAVAADLAVSDKTSLALYFSLLHKPIIFTKINEEEFVEGSPFVRLLNVSPRLLAVQDMEKQIETCLQSDASTEVRLFAEQTFPRIGQKDHLKSAIYESMKHA